MSNLIERYNPFDPVYGDDLNHIIDILDGMRYNLVNVATGPSNARYVIDTTSIRAYDNSSTNYGAPSGAGVTFEVTPAGQVFIGGGNLTIQSAASGPYVLINSSKLVVNDGTRDRWSAGNLLSYTDPKGAVSPAGYNMRLVDASGNLLSDATQTMIYFPVYTGYTPVDGSSPATARFEITSDVVKILKITVSFYCDTFKVGQQTTAAANTSGGGAHSHGLSSNPGTLNQTAGFDVSGNLVNTGAAPNTVSVGGEYTVGSMTSGSPPGPIVVTAHTHAIPSLSINNPNSLFNSGGASGVHVKLYNQAGTLLADHGPYAGGAGVFTTDIDITADTAWAAGWYQIQFTSAGIGGIEGQINIKATVQAG